VVADVSRVSGLAIIDVTDGVADWPLWTSKSVMSTTKSLWVILGQLGLCAAVAELNARTHANHTVHALLTVQWGC